MPAFKQRLARIGATAGVLAVSTAAFMAVGGAGASVASAACVTKGEGTPLAGSGSSLQKEAQANWTNATHFGAECAETPVTYTSTSSGKGLTAFGFQPGSTIEHKTAFIGTDDGPNGEQIKKAEENSKTKPLIIPVAETAIAVVINPPVNCELQTGVTHGISWVTLSQIFGGKEVKTWAQLATAEVVKGTGCTGNITRVVRAEGSGTTYQFKNYLATLQGTEFGGKPMPCELAGFNEETGKAVTSSSWKNMRQVGTEEKPNITWPEPSNCAETSTVVRKAGGGAVAEYVAATDGTIGYAALPDAKAKGAEVAQLQDVSTPRYAGPVKTSTTESNCGERIYTVPTAGRVGGTGEAVDWSQVFGASPAVGSSLYPLCTLTYDVSWKSYEAAGYKEPETGKPVMLAANVKSYMQYLISTNGQKVLTEHYYQKLPTGAGVVANNVLGAAETAINKIG
jgi:ABC-type phosphate transport system substrate-binding protein